MNELQEGKRISSEDVGTWKFNRETQKMEKVSDRPSTWALRLRSLCYVPEGGYFSGNAGHDGRFFADRRDKAEWLARNNLVENPSGKLSGIPNTNRTRKEI